METINKTKFIEALSEKLEISKVSAKEVFEAGVNIVEESVAAGNEVAISNFINIKVVERKARMGTNPQKPEEKIEIPAKQVIKVKVGKRLKELAAGEIEL